ncbi:hypothetical protein [Tateyamaria sp. SN6-1]|uniref:hypothetical protein n=1 Tax=Tateyamaria sp. SN6-1 TaxID=3092148 RepID=UPI0039F5AA57
MRVTHVRLPASIAYPVTVTEVHVTAGAALSKGARLYTLRDATGKTGRISAPADGRLDAGPVPVGAVFAEPVPVASIVPDPATQPDPTPPAEAPFDPTQLNADFAALLKSTADVARDTKLHQYEQVLYDNLVARGHPAKQVSHLRGDARIATAHADARAQKPDTVAKAPSAQHRAKATAPRPATAARQDVPTEPHRPTPEAERNADTVPHLLGWGFWLTVILAAGLLAGLALLRAQFGPGQSGQMAAAVGAAIGIVVLCVVQLIMLGVFRGHHIALSALAGLVGGTFLAAMPEAQFQRSIASLTSAVQPQTGIAAALDLDPIASFSNGRTPTPSAQQQRDFERFILE